ncbi:nucleotidyltransferase [Candidatus Pacearchaeota archaeon]|nr:MAG: nucleotidyltransferase [Candidatus Pacearchaeota archaeon]
MITFSKFSMEAIILCGGLGTRIRTITQDSIPKAMVKIKGKTILEWEIEWLNKHGIVHVILAVRHLADYIQKKLGDSYQTEIDKVKITYSREPKKLGSGGAVRFAEKHVSDEHVIIMNGDVLTNYNLKEMISAHLKKNLAGTIGVSMMRSPYGIVEFDDNLMISEFKEKPLLNHWIHSGIDIFQKKVLLSFPEKGQMEDTIFVELAKKKELSVFKIEPKYYWRSIDTTKDFQEAEKDWPGV